MRRLDPTGQTVRLVKDLGTMTGNLRLKHWIRKAWSNGLLMGALILLLAVVIAWGKVIER